MVKEFIIENNVDSKIINEFVNFYREVTPIVYNKININITGKKEKSGDITGEMDPVFLSYIILFLSEFPNIKVEFVIKDYTIADRAFSLREQLQQIISISGRFSNQIYLKGSYLNKETGEIKETRYDLNKEPNRSQKFIPPFFIENKADIDKYFNKKFSASNNKNTLLNEYYNRLINDIVERTKSGDEPINSFFNEFNPDDLSAFEICVFNLLLSPEIYEDRRKNRAEKAGIIQNDRKRIKEYKEFVKDISVGVKELAMNVVEHSSGKKGVITCRFFDKQRLSLLKGDSEKRYLQQIDDNFFLDLNVIDLGKYSIRETYISNLESQGESQATKEEAAGDKNIIQEKYNYEDFFVINFEKFIHVSHQQNKIISRYGLHYFTYIVKENYSGFIKTSSSREGVYIYKKAANNEDIIIKCPDIVGYGTAYNCIIPVNKTRQNSNHIISVPSTLANEEINTFIELDKYKIIDVSDKDNDIIEDNRYEYIYNISSFSPSPSSDNKYDHLLKIYEKIKAVSQRARENIILINGCKLKHLESDSQWVRLLAGLSLLIPDLIIYNLENETVRQIIRIRQSVIDLPGLKFWNQDSRVLFYSYKEKPDIYGDIYRRYGATLLTGQDIGTFYFINKNIWRHHYSFRNDFFSEIEKEHRAEIEKVEQAGIKPDYSKSKLFSNGNLSFFELLIANEYKGGSSMTLFEQSVQYSLNKEYDIKNDKTNNRGYKISRTHFKLGSKVHIQDFYYAKRLFQNSFFTMPLSYLISDYIYGIVHDAFDEITLMGYEDYSAQLIGNIRNILEKKLQQHNPEYKLNHNTIKDGKLSMDLTTLKKNIIIIVPIATTFSTPLKIHNRLEEIFRINNHTSKYNIIDENINILLVGHSHKDENENKISFEDIAGRPDETEPVFFLYEDNLLRTCYKWHSINKKKKVIKVMDNSVQENKIEQKYFIPVYTRWHNTDDCELCYPAKITEEECLIETSKASITPNLIFDCPKTNTSNKYGGNILSLENFLFYGNLKRGRNHYLYFTPTGRIVNANEKPIRDWLKGLRDKVFNSVLSEYKKVVLVTPATGHKSKFIDLVNEHVFKYTASILSIPLSEDYIENVESLYADGLHESDLIIYVDDVIASSASFTGTNHIVQITKNKIETGKGIDYCIALINRMTYDKENSLLISLKNDNSDLNDIPNETIRFLYYAKFNCPPIEELNNEFPLIKERTRYGYLAETSSVDAVKELFHKKIKKLDTVDISNAIPDIAIPDIAIPAKKDYHNRKLFQFLVLNQFYTLFEESSRDNTINECFTKDISGLAVLENKLLSKLESDTKNTEIIKTYRDNLRYVLLKILCGTPQIYYKDIRMSTFDWIISQLEELVSEINRIYNLTGPDKELESFFSLPSGYSKFQELKFLLKRSVQLKSNYIIHPGCFKAMDKLITLVYEHDKRRITDACDQLLDLFNTTAYLPGKLEIYNYLMENIILFEEYRDVKSFLKNIDTSSIECQIKDNNLSDDNSPFSAKIFSESNRFKEEFEQYKTVKKSDISSKKIIYHLITYIQELINGHETKSIKLEKNIQSLRNSGSGTNNKNGDFNHYLRLLRLENTAAIERFWEYFMSKEIANREEIIDTENFDTIIAKYKPDNRYVSITNVLQDSDSFDRFLNIRSLLYNWNRKINENGVKESVDTILHYISCIIGEEDVTDSFLTVNYNNSEIPEAKDLYVFSSPANRPLSYKTYGLDAVTLKSSITFEMIKGIKDAESYTLSNLEILKQNEPVYRKGFLKKDIKGCPGIKALPENSSVLLVRISDKANKSDKLYSQAVLTVIRKKGERIPEDKLRLILLLRKPIGDFLRIVTSKNTFLELLKNKEREDYQRSLKHGLGDYFNYQDKIIDIINKNGDEYVQQLKYLNKAVKNQILAYDPSNSIKTIYTREEIFNKVKCILESVYIQKIVRENDYTIEIGFDSIVLESVIYEAVLLELLINAKKHSPRIQPDIKCKFTNDYFSISNNYEEPSTTSKSPRKRQGQEMCREICKKHEIEFKNGENNGNHHYEIILNFNKNEERINN
ncbi:hypothetical protein IR083_03875 [Dysgonomonas sp. GY75]|uniref:hypothetical protein n=1 Tax=Dysgonomonas sp. GY75 TaxID=2780419 RepID=UPI00188418A6|nr:hypothetical protein [Dysgonomonas sp. GY75]MBF0647951.1 hypothetical protein [Dysgonomonas sp. GY75]